MALFTFFVSGEPLQGSWELLADIHAEICGYRFPHLPGASLVAHMQPRSTVHHWLDGQQSGNTLD